MTAPSSGAALVFASVGTDFHQFDRLVDWLDRWAAERTHDVACLVQHGTSRAPQVVDGRDYLPYDDMMTTLEHAAVVVSHGGPATIMAARAAGKRPIVVPRRHDLGEHVDGHQIAFSQRLAACGDVALASDEQSLAELLEDALAHPERWTAQRSDSRSDTVRRFGELVDELLERPPRRPGLRNGKR